MSNSLSSIMNEAIESGIKEGIDEAINQTIGLGVDSAFKRFAAEREAQQAAKCRLIRKICFWLGSILTSLYFLVLVVAVGEMATTPETVSKNMEALGGLLILFLLTSGPLLYFSRALPAVITGKRLACLSVITIVLTGTFGAASDDANPTADGKHEADSKTGWFADTNEPREIIKNREEQLALIEPVIDALNPFKPNQVRANALLAEMGDQWFEVTGKLVRATVNDDGSLFVVITRGDPEAAFQGMFWGFVLPESSASKIAKFNFSDTLTLRGQPVSLNQGGLMFIVGLENGELVSK